VELGDSGHPEMKRRRKKISERAKDCVRERSKEENGEKAKQEEMWKNTGDWQNIKTKIPQQKPSIKQKKAVSDRPGVRGACRACCAPPPTNRAQTRCESRLRVRCKGCGVRGGRMVITWRWKMKKLLFVVHGNK
jgi:hypothetical protein